MSFVRRKPLPAAPALFLIAGLFLGSNNGCKGGSEKKPGGTEPAATAQPPSKGAAPQQAYLDERVPGEKRDEGDWLIRSLDGDCATLNYVLFNSLYENFVHMYLYRNLIDYDTKLAYIPGLAEKWEISPDHLTYTFHLRKDATWDDGKPVTAEDFDFTVKKILDPKVPAVNKKSGFTDYDSSRVVDSHTYEIKFKKPNASQLASFNMAIMPKHIWGTGDFVTHPANRKPVGCGPYKFVRWETNKEIELARRDDYWDPKPAFSKIIFKILPDESVRLNAIKTQQVDDARMSSIQWKDNKDDPEFQKNARVAMYYDFGFNFIAWNNASPLFKDKRVRQAMTMLLDRKKIIQSIYFGTATTAVAPFAYGSWARNAAIEPWPYDPPGARKKLEEAGWKDTNGDGILDRDGKKFEFEILNPVGCVVCEQVTQLLQRELERVGVKMTLKPMEYASYEGKVVKGEYDAAVEAMATDVDPDPSPMLHTSQIPPDGFNVARYSNPEMDKLLDEARVEFDQEKRKALYFRAQDLFHQDEPMSMILYPASKWALGNRFKGINTSPLGLWLHYPSSLDWWVPKEKQLHH